MRDSISTCLTSQAVGIVGIKEVDDGISLVSFMDYHLGYIDLEEKSLQLCSIPSVLSSVTDLLGTICYPRSSSLMGANPAPD